MTSIDADMEVAMRANPQDHHARRSMVTTVIVASAVLVAACSSTGAGPSAAIESVPAASAPATISPSPSASASTSGGGRGDYSYEDPPSEAPSASPASGTGTVAVNTATGPLGTYLTGPDNLTLYTFKPDSPNTSTCDGGCAEAWPPFTVEAVAEFVPGDGVEGELTTFPRADGTLQVTYDGMPLYYFANDTTPGDTNGQGLGDNWFVAEP
jgi:predicted lipoprotein with Yx(FWY)xxD motif